MKKHLIQLAVVSVAGHVVTGYALYAQHQTLLKYKAGYRQIHSWSVLVQEIIEQHYKHGGELRVDPETINKLNAFEIFLNNDMV